jgi:hypothetical protein
MKDRDDNDDERKWHELEKKRRRMKPLVNPTTLKVILAVGPTVAKILRLLLELAKLFKD